MIIQHLSDRKVAPAGNNFVVLRLFYSEWISVFRAILPSRQACPPPKQILKVMKLFRLRGLLVEILTLVLITALLPTPSRAQTLFAYVVNVFDNTVSVIDTSTEKVVATIAVPNSPFRLAVTPDGSRVFVTSTGGASVSVIDTATNSVIGIIPVGAEALDVAITPDGSRAYVTVNQPAPSVTVIDTATDTVVDVIQGFTFPSGIAITPDGRHAYVGDSNSQGVVDVFDTATNTKTDAIFFPGFDPNQISITPDGTLAYVTLFNPIENKPGAISVISTANNSKIQEITDRAQFDPEVVAFTPDSTTAYVSVPSASAVDVIAVASGLITDRIGLGAQVSPEGVAITPDGTRAYIGDLSVPSTVLVVDTASNRVIDKIIAGNGSRYIAFATLNKSTISLSPTSLTFPTTLKGAQSAPQVVTLTNTGTVAVTIDSITVSTSGDFHSHNTCPSSLAAGANCTITAIFRPQAKGTRTGTITITDSAAGSPQTVPLAGTGTILTFSPPSLDFGDQGVGTSQSHTITMSNHSGSPVTITTLTIKGTNLNDFSQTNNCGTSLAGNSSCTITVTFMPIKTGARSANVWIADDGGGSPQILPLSGNGT